MVQKTVLNTRIWCKYPEFIEPVFLVIHLIYKLNKNIEIYLISMETFTKLNF